MDKGQSGGMEEGRRRSALHFEGNFGIVEDDGLEKEQCRQGSSGDHRQHHLGIC